MLLLLLLIMMPDGACVPFWSGLIWCNFGEQLITIETESEISRVSLESKFVAIKPSKRPKSVMPEMRFQRISIVQQMFL